MPIRELIGHGAPVEALAFSPGGDVLVTASGDATIRFWSPLEGKCWATLRGHGGAVTAVCFSPDGRRIASRGNDPEGRGWDAAGLGPALRVMSPANGSPRAMAYSPDGKSIATGGWWNVQFWDPDTGARQRVISGPASCLAFSPLGDTLLEGIVDDGLRL